MECCGVGQSGVVSHPIEVRRPMPETTNFDRIGQQEPNRGHSIAIHWRVRAHHRREVSAGNPSRDSCWSRCSQARHRVLRGAWDHGYALALAGEALRADGSSFRGFAASGRGLARIRGTAVLTGIPSGNRQVGTHTAPGTIGAAGIAGLVCSASGSQRPSRTSRSRAMGAAARRKAGQAGRNHDEGSPRSSAWPVRSEGGTMTRVRLRRADGRLGRYIGERCTDASRRRSGQGWPA